MTAVVAAATHGAPDPLRVRVSQDPHERLGQVEAFWRRNPGFHSPSSVGERLRTFAQLLPGARGVAERFTPPELGFGQPIVDQMRWQIRTGRQPGSRWWMRMNERLVGDAMTAEAYVRAGRVSEGERVPGVRPWIRYIFLSDAARGAAQQGETHRLRSLQRQARHAYWTAHDESVNTGSIESRALLAQMRQHTPREAAFSEAWARSVTLYRHTNPSAANDLTTLVNHTLLPQHFPLDAAPLTRSQAALERVLEGAARLWPR